MKRSLLLLTMSGRTGKRRRKRAARKTMMVKWQKRRTRKNHDPQPSLSFCFQLRVFTAMKEMFILM